MTGGRLCPTSHRPRRLATPGRSTCPPRARGRELDAADPGPGYDALGGFGNAVDTRSFLPIWTPGATPHFCREDTGYKPP